MSDLPPRDARRRVADFSQRNDGETDAHCTGAPTFFADRRGRRGLPTRRARTRAARAALESLIA